MPSGSRASNDRDALMPDLFDTVLWPFIASQESGKLSLDPDDRGNWTSGECGVGELRGSKFGISAAAFPTIDIPNVTYDQAGAICRSEFFLHPLLRCDLLPFPIGALLCDAAWGSGPKVAAETLQSAIGAAQDGDIGDKTRALVNAEIARAPLYTMPSGLHQLVAEFAAERIIFESQIGTWSKYEGGWVRRITRSLCLVVPYCTPTTAPKETTT
jgi:lysozyme family protein